MAKSDVLVRMKADVSNYDANIAKARKTLDGFKQDNLTMGGILNQSTKSIVAAAAQYASFAAILGTVVSGFSEAISKGIEMSREAEGVKAAFDRLNQPGLLDNLREATHGTVNDLELMKQAVKFDNFNLSLEQMGTFLAFAQQQAKDTGQDVNFLVDSIVTGLGRKSLPILDNLGLSATEIRERMKETGDMTKAVADIIQERMNAAGGYVETAADRAARATADMENAMMKLGETFGPITQNSDSLWNSIKIGAINSLNYVGDLINYLHEAGRISKIIGNMNGGGMMERFGNNLRNSKNPSSLYQRQLAEINRSINSAEAKLQQAEKGGMGSIQIYRERVQALKEIKSQYQELYKVISMPPKPITTTTDPVTTHRSGRSSKGFDISSIVFNAQKVTPEQMIAPPSVWEQYAEGIRGTFDTIGDSMSNFTEWTANFDPYTDKMNEMTKAAKQQQMAMGLAANAVGSFSQALSGMDDPAAKAAGTVMQAIASIALGFATASAQANTAGTGWGWLAWIAAGMSAMATTIATVHSLTGYSQGGIVSGNSYSGDNIYAGNAMVNSGELILNKAQQSSIASQLDGNGMRSINVVGRISGTDILLSADRTLMTQGKQLAVWGG